MLRPSADSSLSPYRGRVDHRIVVRLVQPGEHHDAGAATARAFMEFAPERDSEWRAYLARIADVAGRVSRAIVLVALNDGVIVGSATLELEQRIRDDPERPLGNDEAHLRMVGVDPAYRGHGVARRLVLACIDLARTNGKRRLTLDTGERMHAARALYEGLGFRRSGSREMDGGLVLQSYELRLDAPAVAPVESL
ncbi:MAG: GNAT family N-acetyltransferase [Chloroflexi bacterium]|nr:MAG: GNAT family N-acetyltransferase [Chloroflexota bacterium]